MNVPFDYTAGISKALGSFIESKSATFACGGSIPVKHADEGTQPAIPSTTSVVSPIILRWDSTASSTGISKLQFPINTSDEFTHSVLSNLVRECRPASFGYKGENVLNETYRKAMKMDRSAFSVDFCPYEVGIIDTIAQLLLPNSGAHVSAGGVRAELYKLNIYAAPSGFFKSHVDTPRSATQFGSLVVSLPCHHKGGQLIVRHARFTKTFDWGTYAPQRDFSPVVQWAAFYSDCEHEVLEVTEGFRIILTYNLYHAPGVGNMAGNSVTMDVKSIPLFQYVEEALQRIDFMPHGGYLGIYCQHAYAHTHEDGARTLPQTLKGSDMAVYDVFKAVGLEIQVRAILDARDSLDEYIEDYEERTMYDSEDEVRSDYEPPRLQTHAVVGNLGGYGTTETGGWEEQGIDEIIEEWSESFMNIVWVNEPHHSGPDMVHLTYGNQAGIGTLYSFAALLVRIPSPHERGLQGMQNNPVAID